MSWEWRVFIAWLAFPFAVYVVWGTAIRAYDFYRRSIWRRRRRVRRLLRKHYK